MTPKSVYFYHISICHSRTQFLRQTWNLLTNTLTLLPRSLPPVCPPHGHFSFASTALNSKLFLMHSDLTAPASKKWLYLVSRLSFKVGVTLHLQEVSLLPEHWSLCVCISWISSFLVMTSPLAPLGSSVCSYWSQRTLSEGTVPLPLTGVLICTLENVNF